MSYLARALRGMTGELIFYVALGCCYWNLYTACVTGFFDTDVIGSTFSCGEPCIIENSPGGYLDRFERAAKAVHRGERRQIVIDGRCASACALFADLARPHVCITERAMLAFHKGSGGNLDLTEGLVTFRFDPPQSKDIKQWVEQRGGYPTVGVLRMYSDQAVRFWPLCDLNPPLPRPRPHLDTPPAKNK
jgi:hypothetical protein